MLIVYMTVVHLDDILAKFGYYIILSQLLPPVIVRKTSQFKTVCKEDSGDVTRRK